VLKTFKQMITKKFFLPITAIIILLFCSCSKENDQPIPLQQNFSTKSEVLLKPAYFLMNDKNPYDKYGISTCSFYNDLAVLYGDEAYNDIEKFKEAFDILVEKHKSDLYPQVDTSEYFEGLEDKILKSFSDNVTYKNIKDLSFSIEKEILNNSDLSDFQRERLLCMISMMKFSYYYNIEISLIYGTFEDEVDDCMHSTLGQIFANDGNPWPEIEFVAGCPASYFWVLAKCVHQACQNSIK